MVSLPHGRFSCKPCKQDSHHHSPKIQQAHFQAYPTVFSRTIPVGLRGPCQLYRWLASPVPSRLFGLRPHPGDTSRGPSTSTLDPDSGRGFGTIAGGKVARHPPSTPVSCSSGAASPTTSLAFTSWSSFTPATLTYPHDTPANEASLPERNCLSPGAGPLLHLR